MEYTEILKLKKMLVDAGIPFCTEEYQNGYHLHSDGFTVDSFNTGWSVIEHDGSYGRDTDLHIDAPVYAIHLVNVKEAE